MSGSKMFGISCLTCPKFQGLHFSCPRILQFGEVYNLQTAGKKLRNWRFTAPEAKKPCDGLMYPYDGSIF